MQRSLAKVTSWLLPWTKGLGGLARNTQTVVFAGRGGKWLATIWTNTKYCWFSSKHMHAHTHCLIHSNAASCAVTSAYPAQDKFTQSLEHPVHPVLVCSVMIFMTWTPAIRETQHHKPNTHAGTQSVNAIPSSPAHSTYKQKKKYRQCKNLLWRSVKSSLDFSPLPVSPQLQSI